MVIIQLYKINQNFKYSLSLKLINLNKRVDSNIFIIIKIYNKDKKKLLFEDIRL